ncbi:hypothetical protein ACMYSQ_002677 [Aspergillus niger]
MKMKALLFTEWRAARRPGDEPIKRINSAEEIGFVPTSPALFFHPIFEGKKELASNLGFACWPLFFSPTHPVSLPPPAAIFCNRPVQKQSFAQRYLSPLKPC